MLIALLTYYMHTCTGFIDDVNLFLQTLVRLGMNKNYPVFYVCMLVSS